MRCAMNCGKEATTEFLCMKVCEICKSRLEDKLLQKKIDRERLKA